MRRYLFALVMLALVAHGGDVRSAPLDADGCVKLKGELTQLEQSGARANLAKGADWGRSNLAPGKLEEVKRLIEVDEQLLFRCNGKPLVLLPEGSEPDLTGGAGKAGEKKDAPKTHHKVVRKKPPAKKAAVEPPAKPAPETPVKAAAPKPKPKEKVNDAYQPPRPASPAGDPFSRQLQAPAAK